ncbi:hypothetical protein F2P79_021557 [Pimephales promelas]|nr:hypothetical protein F2P79_021557 [Pimephales promelas]
MICGKGACLPASKRGRGSRGCVSQLMRAAFLTRAHFISNAGVSGNASRSFVRSLATADQHPNERTDTRTDGPAVRHVCVCDLAPVSFMPVCVGSGVKRSRLLAWAA